MRTWSKHYPPAHHAHLAHPLADRYAGARVPVRNPRTGRYDAAFERPAASHISRLTRALRAAQPRWAALSVQQRCDALLRWVGALDRHSAAIRDALVADTGRVRESVMEIACVKTIIRRWCKSAPYLLAQRDATPCEREGMCYAGGLVPYGLVGVISPWNVPLVLALIDAVPALLAGSAVIIKPSEVTPRFIAPLMASLAAVPELADVLCFTPGDGETGKIIVDHVDVVVFTGSVATGRDVARRAATRLIPVYLELGGKDPAIVTESAQLDHAVAAISWGSLTNAGQACQALERIYVHRSIYDTFVERLVKRVSALQLTCDDPEKGVIGPIIAEQQIHTLRRHLDDARARGAKILCGGSLRRDHGGTWCEPTVLVNVDHQMLVMTEESFGPLLPVMAYDDITEAVALANDSEYGLSAAVFAHTTEEASRIANQLAVGAVSINDCALTAFVHEAEKQSFKNSGLGASRMGKNAIYRFLRKRAQLINNSKQFQPWWF